MYSVTVSDANGCGNVSLDYFLMESGNFIMGVTPKDTLVKIGQPVIVFFYMNSANLLDVLLATSRLPKSELSNTGPLSTISC